MKLNNKEFVKIQFQPLGLREQFQPSMSILECGRKCGADILSLCGGAGTCGKCRVQIISGNVSEVLNAEKKYLSEEDIALGYRLACKTYAKSDLVVNVPPESLSAPQRVQFEGLVSTAAPDPSVIIVNVKIDVPSLSDLRGDDKRLFDAVRKHDIACKKIDEKLISTFPEMLRSLNWEVSVATRNSGIVDMGRPDARNYGMAVDLGTTKIAGYLIDLNTGNTLSSSGTMNPQISYGEDIIARMFNAEKSQKNAAILQEKAIQAISTLSKELCSVAGNIRTEEIREIVVAGNTAMHHLLLGLPVKQLSRAPHVPAVSNAFEIKAGSLKLPFSQGAYAYFFPNIAGFVGGDHLAFLLAVRAWESRGTILAIDIGTNTEISLIHNGIISSVSCASGPAFEGAHISCGMRAASGAIEHVRILDHKIQYHTIPDSKPAGICGSGIFDILSELLHNGIINNKGKMQNNHKRIRENQKGLEFVILSEEENEGKAIVITQSDIRELQLAKAAIWSGIKILLGDSGISENDISEVIIAGAFGSYINISSAINVGMLPRLPLKRFRQVGNAAGAGAKEALISMALRKKAEEMALQIRYIELAAVPEFNKTFLEALALG